MEIQPRGLDLRWFVALQAVLTLVGLSCEAPAPDPSVTAAVFTAPAPTAAPTRPLAVAQPVGSPTPTPALVGDFATLARPRVQTLRDGFSRLDQQLAVAQKAPMRMADDDWRNQTADILANLLSANSDLRALGTRVSGQVALEREVVKVVDDVDFVANEYRMAFDYDPDSSHFLRATRAEKTTVSEVDSLLDDLRRAPSR
jgi:hypothetical protein